MLNVVVCLEIMLPDCSPVRLLARSVGWSFIFAIFFIFSLLFCDCVSIQLNYV